MLEVNTRIRIEFPGGNGDKKGLRNYILASNDGSWISRPMRPAIVSVKYAQNIKLYVQLNILTKNVEVSQKS